MMMIKEKLEIDTATVSVNGVSMLYSVLQQLEDTERVVEYHQLLKEMAGAMKSHSFIPVDTSLKLAKQYFDIVLVERETKHSLSKFDANETRARTRYKKLSARVADIYGRK